MKKNNLICSQFYEYHSRTINVLFAISCTTVDQLGQSSPIVELQTFCLQFHAQQSIGPYDDQINRMPQLNHKLFVRNFTNNSRLITCNSQLMSTQFGFYRSKAVVFMKNDDDYQNPPLFFAEKCVKLKTNANPKFSISKFKELISI